MCHSSVHFSLIPDQGRRYRKESACRHGGHFNRLPIIALLFVSVIGCQTRTSLKRENSQLEKTVESSTKELIAAEQTSRELRVELDTLQKENHRLEIGGNIKAGIGPTKPLANDLDTQNFALNKLENTWDQRSNSLLPGNQIDRHITKLQDTNEPLVSDAQQILAAQPDRLNEAKLKYQNKPATVAAQSDSPVWAMIRGFLSRDYLTLWLLLIGAFLLIWCIVRHDFRHSIRSTRRAIVNAVRLEFISRQRGVFRLVWSYRFYVFATLLFGIALVSLTSPRPTQLTLLAEYKAHLEQKIKTNNEGIQIAERVVAKLHRDIEQEKEHRHAMLVTNVTNLVNATVGLPAEHAKEAQKQKREDLLSSHATARSQVNRHLQTTGSLRAAGPLLQQHQFAAGEIDTEANTFINQAHRHEIRLLIGKLGLLLAFALLNVGLVAQWRRKRRTRLGQIEQTCPKCLREGTLEPLETTGDSKAGKVSRPVMRCNWEEPATETTKKLFCGYLMDDLHRKAPRLRIPTAGYTTSGKTVWLSMFHREVQKGGAKAGRLSLDRATSAGSDDADYTAVLKALVEDRSEPKPTMVARIQDPLLFNFSDGERIFRSSGILNLFDLGGEMTSQFMAGTVDQDRALRDTQGFLYFIDPIAKNEKNESTLNLQRDQLAHFCEEVRTKRGVAYHKPLPVPIAVCITKLDMLHDEQHKNTPVYDFIDQLNPAQSQEELTLKELRRRHRLVTEYQNHIFPGWELDKLLTKLVGGRFLFFPMSAIGFGNTGDDFATFNFRPFGIVEPLLWLTHMNGYKVL